MTAIKVITVLCIACCIAIDAQPNLPDDDQISVFLLKQEFQKQQLQENEIRTLLREREPTMKEEDIDRLVAKRMVEADKEAQEYAEEKFRQSKTGGKKLEPLSREELIEKGALIKSLRVQLEMQQQRIVHDLGVELNRMKRVKLIKEEESIRFQMEHLDKQLEDVIDKELIRQLGGFTVSRQTQEDLRHQILLEIKEFMQNQQEKTQKTQQAFSASRSEAGEKITAEQQEQPEQPEWEFSEDEIFEEDHDHYGQSVFLDADEGHLGQEDDGGQCGGPNEDDEDESELISQVNDFNPVAEAILENRMEDIRREREQKKPAAPKLANLSPDEARMWQKKVNQAIKKQERKRAQAAAGSRVNAETF